MNVEAVSAEVAALRLQNVTFEPLPDALKRCVSLSSCYGVAKRYPIEPPEVMPEEDAEAILWRLRLWGNESFPHPAPEVMPREDAEAML